MKIKSGHFVIIDCLWVIVVSKYFFYQIHNLYRGSSGDGRMGEFFEMCCWLIALLLCLPTQIILTKNKRIAPQTKLGIKSCIAGLQVALTFLLRTFISGGLFHYCFIITVALGAYALMQYLWTEYVIDKPMKQ